MEKQNIGNHRSKLHTEAIYYCTFLCTYICKPTFLLATFSISPHFPFTLGFVSDNRLFAFSILSFIFYCSKYQSRSGFCCDRCFVYTHVHIYGYIKIYIQPVPQPAVTWVWQTKSEAAWQSLSPAPVSDLGQRGSQQSSALAQPPCGGEAALALVSPETEELLSGECRWTTGGSAHEAMPVLHQATLQADTPGLTRGHFT